MVARRVRGLRVCSASDVAARTGAGRTTPRPPRRPSARQASPRPSRNRRTETGGTPRSAHGSSGERRIHTRSGGRTPPQCGAVFCPAPTTGPTARPGASTAEHPSRNGRRPRCCRRDPLLVRYPESVAVGPLVDELSQKAGDVDLESRVEATFPRVDGPMQGDEGAQVAWPQIIPQRESHVRIGG